MELARVNRAKTAIAVRRGGERRPERSVGAAAVVASLFFSGIRVTSRMTARRPGTMARKKRVRSSEIQKRSRSAATIGPTSAPALSMAR